MTPNPFSGLLHSRKFLLLMLDILVSTLTLVLTTFLAPQQTDFPLKLIAIYQPAFVTIITMIAVEDVQNSKAAVSVAETKAYSVPASLVDSQGNVVNTVVNPVQLKPNP
jgi:hypothetical protein